jgi:hypothetical protein
MTEQNKISLEKILGFFKSVQGIITSIGVIVAFGFTVSGHIAKHDAKVIKSYVDSTQVKTNIRIGAIEKTITDLTTSVNHYTEISNDNFTTVKNEFSNHIQKSKEIAPDDRLETILRIVKGIETEQKKTLKEIQ